jgi:hypothetical protein
MANHYGPYKSQPKKQPKADPLEVKILLGILRGLRWLILLPFSGVKGGKTKSRQSASVDTQEVTKRWSDIQTSIGLGGATHFGSAVVAADKLLDYVLRQKGYAGETMGERLRAAQPDLTSETYNQVWQAHKLRNTLVHEIEGEVLSFQAKEAITSFEKGLKELGALR